MKQAVNLDQKLEDLFFNIPRTKLVTVDDQTFAKERATIMEEMSENVRL